MPEQFNHFNGYSVGDKIKWKINPVDVGEGFLESFGVEGASITFRVVSDSGFQSVGFATTIFEIISDK